MNHTYINTAFPREADFERNDITKNFKEVQFNMFEFDGKNYESALDLYARGAEEGEKAAEDLLRKIGTDKEDGE